MTAGFASRDVDLGFRRACGYRRLASRMACFENQFDFVGARFRSFQQPKAVGVRCPGFSRGMSPVLPCQHGAFFVNCSHDDTRRGVVIRPCRTDISEPIFVTLFQTLEDIRVFCGNVVLLPRVFTQIIKLKLWRAGKTFFTEAAWMDQLPGFFVQRKVVVLLGHVTSVGLQDNLSCWPVGVVTG